MPPGDREQGRIPGRSLEPVYNTPPPSGDSPDPDRDNQDYRGAPDLYRESQFLDRLSVEILSPINLTESVMSSGIIRVHTDKPPDLNLCLIILLLTSQPETSFISPFRPIPATAEERNQKDQRKKVRSYPEIFSLIPYGIPDNLQNLLTSAHF